MLTAMTEEDWTIVLRVFVASRSRRGDKGRNDRKFLEALHYFVVHNITWRALPEKFGHWNSVWKRFWRLSRSGTFEAFFDALAARSLFCLPRCGLRFALALPLKAATHQVAQVWLVTEMNVVGGRED